MAFDVACFRGLPDREVFAMRPARLIAQYERVERAQYNRAQETILSTEIGVLRALARGFGGIEPPDMQDYDAYIAERARAAKGEKPTFIQRIEAANRERSLQRRTP